MLVIEDDPDVAAALLMLLAGLPVDAHVASNGIEGIARARELRPDVILLDGRLPGMDGFDVFRLIQADNKLAHARVIFVSSSATDGALGLMRDGGAFACLRKPFRPDFLRENVLAALGLPTDSKPGARNIHALMAAAETTRVSSAGVIFRGDATERAPRPQRLS